MRRVNCTGCGTPGPESRTLVGSAMKAQSIGWKVKMTHEPAGVTVSALCPVCSLREGR